MTAPRQPKMLNWTIICDFDGTIAKQHVTQLLLERFARVEWKLIERSWQAGLLGSRECLRRQVGLLTMTQTHLNTVLHEITMDPAFPAFVTRALAAGCDVRIASEGFDQVIRPLLARANVPPLRIAATYLLASGYESWQLDCPFAERACRSGAATCKCALAVAAERAHRRVVLIGGGLSDTCVAHRADLVFARGRLLDYCREHEIEHEEAVDFSAVLRHLGLLFGPAVH